MVHWLVSIQKFALPPPNPLHPHFDVVIDSLKGLYYYIRLKLTSINHPVNNQLINHTLFKEGITVKVLYTN